MNSRNGFAVRIVATVGALAVLVALLFVNIFFFERIFGFSYFSFWLNKGSVIGLSFTMVSLVWSDLDKQHPNIISAQPASYLATSFLIISGIFLAVVNSIPRKGFLSSSRLSNTAAVGLIYETLVAILLHILVSLVALAWLLVVAPAMYFITLVLGAPARLGIRAAIPELALEREAPQADGSMKTESFTPSLVEKPVATTGVLTALVLWLIAALV